MRCPTCPNTLKLSLTQRCHSTGERSRRNEHATTRQARLRLGQLTHLQRMHRQPSLLQALPRLWIGCGEEERRPQPECIGSERLLRVHLDSLNAGKDLRVDPLGIEQYGVLVHACDCGLQVQTAGERDGLDLVAEGQYQVAELADAFHIGSFRLPHKNA